MLIKFVRIFVCLMLFSMFLIVSVTAEAKPNFNAQEREFIAQNPVITYHFDEGWPVDFRDGKHHVGLSREYLNLIEKYSGLIFKMTDSHQEPELITNLIPSLMPAEKLGKWHYSARWFTSNTLIITANDTTNIRSLEEMKGKRVAVRTGTWYESWLTENHPDIVLLPQEDVRAVFESVWLGNADAGLGSDLIMRPLLYRNYSDKLVIAGQIPEMVAGLHMGIRHDRELLQGIISKSLAAMTATETDQLFNRWVGGLRLGYPSASVILSLYALELSFFVLLVLVLVWALHRALLHKRRAIQSEIRKSQFLAMMSHEIRTPMNALIAALELLRLPCAERQRSEFVTLAWSSSEYLLRLLNDILDHSKLSEQQVQLNNHRFCISAMMSTLIAVNKPAAMAKNLSLNASLDNTLHSQWIITDEPRLTQVINNLLSNAIKFTERGEVWLKMYRENDMLVIEVADTGIGIPEDAQSKLFEAWTQGDNTATRRYDGSGLGLYICNEVVRLLRGTLTCSSKPGTGSSFRIVIPVTFCEPPALPVSDGDASLLRFAPETSVLVIEDHPANQRMLSAQLATLGCYCDIAGSGEEALMLIREENYYDVILLDCNLPDIEGYEVARRIRNIEADRAIPPTPVVAVSALSGQEHRRRCNESGVDVLLTKPISLGELASVLARWCRMTDSPSATVISPSLTEVDFMDDIQMLAAAFQNDDIRQMIHYAHRLKGVAQMYQQPLLAEMADEIETHLRGGQRPEPDEGKQWIDALLRLVITSTHP